jgi:hypothetical protein
LGRIGGDNVRDCGRRILNALMTTDAANTLNWKGKGDKRIFNFEHCSWKANSSRFSF